MKRRTLVRLGLLVLLAIIAIAGVSLYLWITSSSRRINRAAFERIKEGMTVAEVEAVFGCPPGIYCSDGASMIFGPGFIDDEGRSKEDRLQINLVFKQLPIHPDPMGGKGPSSWVSNAAMVTVHFHDGKVWTTAIYDIRYTFADMLNEWLSKLR